MLTHALLNSVIFKWHWVILGDFIAKYSMTRSVARSLRQLSFLLCLLQSGNVSKQINVSLTCQDRMPHPFGFWGYQNFAKIPTGSPQWASNMGLARVNGFRPVVGYISQTAQVTVVIIKARTGKRMQYLECAIFNDLEWPLTHISRVHHH